MASASAAASRVRIRETFLWLSVAFAEIGEMFVEVLRRLRFATFMVSSSSRGCVDEEMVKIGLGWISRLGLIEVGGLVGLVLNWRGGGVLLNGGGVFGSGLGCF